MKILVAHPAQQHSYQLATALERQGLLEAYITTVYYKERNLTSLATKFLKGSFKKKAISRHMSGVADSKVIQFCEGEGLLKLAAMNMRKLNKLYNPLKYHTADRFAKKVANYAIKHNIDAVVTYDDSSPLLFEILSQKAPGIVRVLDMSAANLHYMKRIYDKDIEIQPDFSGLLKEERAILWDKNVMDRALREIQSTQYFLTPSSFVEKSLAYSGVKSEQMLRCPYGVDVTQFSCKKFQTVVNRPLQFVYVGGVKELKGISYLLDAFMQIPESKAQLTVVGSVDFKATYLQKYLNHVHFSGMVLHSEIPAILQQSDVFVFPSLGEGLSLSTLEAAACGLPLIVSENSGVNDGVTDGQEGFVIPIQSSQAIVEKVNWFIGHPDQIETMGQTARKMALQYTWDNYYDQVTKNIQSKIQND